MHWERGQKNNLSEILDFLLPIEETCVSLTSKFYTTGRAVWPLDNPTVAILRSNGQVEGIMYVSSRGLALPSFSGPAEESFQQHFPPLFLRKSFKGIHTCIGMRTLVEKVEELKQGSRHKVRYFLMVQGNQAGASAHYDSRIPVYQAGTEHRERLFPLHAAYEKEEVLLVPEKFNEKFHRALFEKILASQYYFFAVQNGNPVGTAATNAIGFSWCQLGSVFTVPEHRKQGIASVLVSKLCRELNARGKKACLYVKTDNPAAVTLYKGLGFSTVSEYQISYFS